MIAVVQGGGANLSSVLFALDRLGIDHRLTTDPDVIRKAPRVILPGVGAAARCMDAVQRAELVECLRSLRQPVLGICVGMQMLFDSSQEGETPLLSILSGRIERFAQTPGFTIPHMGWNRLIIAKSSPLLDGIEQGAYVYFVHSYYVPKTACHDSQPALAWCDYIVRFTAIVQKENYYGCQFHPERSGTTGHQLLANFARMSS
ncbi:MAG: imidazole glycerol phosphate synthase subunit HisH [Pseudomonadota bacterium]